MKKRAIYVCLFLILGVAAIATPRMRARTTLWDEDSISTETIFLSPNNNDIQHVTQEEASISRLGNNCYVVARKIIIQPDTLCADDNHPHMIDLGLPSGTKWACCNFGAARPSQEGVLLGHEQVDGNSLLPTIEQANELAAYCISKETHDGIYLIGPNGNIVFFPKHHVLIPSWYKGKTGRQSAIKPVLWTSTFEGATESGQRVWWFMFTPGETNDYWNTNGNGVHYPARYVQSKNPDPARTLTN